MVLVKNDYLKYGSDEAPLKLEAYLNLSCPGSAIFHKAQKEVLGEYIESGKVQLFYKLYDKPREELLHGTLIHLGLHYDRLEETLQIIDRLFENQSEWLSLNDSEIKNLLVTKYALEEEEVAANTDISLAFTLEAIERNVKVVPSLFINSKQKHFVFKDISTELRDFVEEELLQLN